MKSLLFDTQQENADLKAQLDSTTGEADKLNMTLKATHALTQENVTRAWGSCTTTICPLMCATACTAVALNVLACWKNNFGSLVGLAVYVPVSCSFLACRLE